MKRSAYSSLKVVPPGSDGYLMEPMKRLNRLLSKLSGDESGQDLIEYALVAALIGLGATATMRTLATSIGAALAVFGTRLTNAV